MFAGMFGPSRADPGAIQHALADRRTDTWAYVVPDPTEMARTEATVLQNIVARRRRSLPFVGGRARVARRPAHGQNLQHRNKPNQILAAVAWTNYSSGCWRPAGRPAPGPTNHVHLSHFLRRTGERELIEPLTGIARHPFARVTCENQSAPLETAPRDALDYLVLRNRCGDSGPKPRTLLFDLGASVGFRGVSGGMYEAAPDASASGTAPSLPLLYRLYEDRCLEPDDIFAWEPNMRFSATEWWGELPARLRAKVRLYNTYVEEGALADAADGAQGRPASFIHMLEAVAAPDHFVAVKVDIDTPDVELTIVETLAERPELAALVDELFFEYHFFFDGLNFGSARESHFSRAPLRESARAQVAG